MTGNGLNMLAGWGMGSRFRPQRPQTRPFNAPAMAGPLPPAQVPAPFGPPHQFEQFGPYQQPTPSYPPQEPWMQTGGNQPAQQAPSYGAPTQPPGRGYQRREGEQFPQNRLADLWRNDAAQGWPMRWTP